jgi:hypothetical protein
MFAFRQNKIFIALIALTLLVSACSSSQQTRSQIATSVAQTVQAQNSLTEVADLPTATPIPAFEISSTPNPLMTNTSAPVIGEPGCTTSARLVSENPPDNALLKPGEYFWKTWSLQNTGTCTWDSTYKLIYSSGDLMGALISYPLPEIFAPGDTKDISIYLKAPDTEGTFTGYWLIQTPWNTYFGVGENIPFYVQIEVLKDAANKYGIISVTYTIKRDPAEGCPVNVRYTVYATITVNGPYEFQYYWEQSDGNESGVQTMKFTEAGSKTISRDWLVGKGDNPNSRWMQIIVTTPEYQEYDKAVFQNNCP